MLFVNGARHLVERGLSCERTTDTIYLAFIGNHNVHQLVVRTLYTAPVPTVFMS